MRGGAYVVRALLTANVYGDLDYGPNEYARVFVDGSQHGPNCFGGEDTWLTCADAEDVTHLLATRAGGSTVSVQPVAPPTRVVLVKTPRRTSRACWTKRLGPPR